MGQPNFLFLFPDQWRWDWLGCAKSGIPVRTPHIDALAARGRRFTNCRTNSPLCAPARACLALGQRYHRCGVPENNFDLDPSRRTIFSCLRDAGYRTLTCGKNDLHKKTKWKGVDGWTQLLGRYGFSDAIDQSGKLDCAGNGGRDRGGPHCSYASYLHAECQFDLHAADYQRRHGEATYSTAAWPSPLDRERYTDDFCGRMALRLLDRTPAEGPWMLWVNFPGPHDPFDPPRELQKRYDGVTFPDAVNAESTYGNDKAVDHQQLRRNYAACCEGIDEWVGRIIDAVAQRGELDNTVIIFCSDHGEMLGDHGCWTKKVWYEGSVHVPLVVAGPGITPAPQDDRLVELIDVGATMLDLADVAMPPDADARSILGEPRNVQFSALGDWRMAFDGRFKLVEQAGRSHLYDLKSDPGETRYVIGEHDAVAASLAAQLAADLR